LLNTQNTTEDWFISL